MAERVSATTLVYDKHTPKLQNIEQTVTALDLILEISLFIGLFVIKCVYYTIGLISVVIAR